MAYVSVAELLAVLGPGADPARAQLAADSVSEWIDARTGHAFPVPPDPLLGARAAVEAFEYTWNATLVAPPSSGQIRANAADQTAAALLWLSSSSVAGVDVGRVLVLAGSGSRVDVQDKDDATKYQQWLVTAPAVDHTATAPGYVELPVSWLSGGLPIGAQRVMVTLLLGSGGDTGAVPARIHQLALNGALRFYHDPEAPYGVIAATSDVPMYMRSLMTDADALLLGLREDFGLG